MSTSTTTRATRSGKMTKEDNSDIVAADTATTQGKTESNAIAAVETVTATTDPASATVVERSNDADKLNSTKEEEQRKEASAAAVSAAANTGDASVKPDASMTEATQFGHATISGDVEFTANFPQKVRSTNLRILYL